MITFERARERVLKVNPTAAAMLILVPIMAVSSDLFDSEFQHSSQFVAEVVSHDVSDLHVRYYRGVLLYWESPIMRGHGNAVDVDASTPILALIVDVTANH
jgi:hypothetical protein